MDTVVLAALPTDSAMWMLREVVREEFKGLNVGALNSLLHTTFFRYGKTVLKERATQLMYRISDFSIPHAARAKSIFLADYYSGGNTFELSVHKELPLDARTRS